MLSSQERNALVTKLLGLCPKPISELHKRSKLARATVKKFIEGAPIREVNLQKLLSVSTDMIEERQTKRNAFLEQQKRIKENEVNYDMVTNEIKNR